MEIHKIDCALSQTRRRGKGDLTYKGYILKYCGGEKHKRATASVGLLINNKFTQNIKDTFYVNERILRVVLDIGKDKIHLLSVYAHEEIDTFYEHLQDEINKIRNEEKS